MRFKSIYIILFFLPLLAISQQKQIKFEHLENKSGLSQSNVTCILQDSRGFMWFGTRDGLNRYDGYKFIVYKNNPSDSSSISENFITDIKEDKSGDLWVATRGGGINKFDRSKNRFINYKHIAADKNSLCDDIVNTLALDNKDCLWIGTESGGLDMFDMVHNRFTHFAHKSTGISDNFIRDIFIDSKQNVWIGTAYGGLNFYNPVTKTFTVFKKDIANPGSLNCNDVYVIFEDYLQRLWVGTNGGGISLFNSDSKSFISYKSTTLDKNGLNKNQVYALNEDKDHNLWIGTENGGLSVLNTKTEVFTNYLHDDIDNFSISNNSIYSICRDSKGNMWVGTFSGGVNFYNKDNQFRHYRHTQSANSLSNNQVLSFFEDAQNKIWIGTDGGGLNYFDPVTESFTHYLHDNNSSNTLCGNYVLTICDDKDGNLWIGTWNDGISVYNPTSKKFTHLEHKDEDSTSLSNNNVWKIYKDRELNLWIGTIGGGLNKYDYQTKSFTHIRLKNENISSQKEPDNIQCFYDDGEGNLWLGTNGSGLIILNKNTLAIKSIIHGKDSALLAGKSVSNIFKGSQGYYWLATNNGLFQLNKLTGRLNNFTTLDGLPSNQVFGIIEDNSNYLWISTGNGICKMDLSRKKFKTYTLNDGLQSNEFKENAFCSAHNGALYFGGTFGFNVFFPYNILKPSYDPQLIMTGFKLSNKDVQIAQKENDESPLKQDISETKELTLSYKNPVIQFEFASLNYGNNDKKQYAYMLEGFDKNFSSFSTKRTATYTNLDPGTYTFRVKGLNNDGSPSTHELRVQLIITPPFWLTWWFRITALGIIVISIFLLYRYRINHEKQRQLVLEAMVKERTYQLQLSSEEEKKAREDAENARKEAEDANKAKSVFLATMSHEIRTPMNGVIGMSTLLAQTELTSKQKEYADVIRICGDTLLNVINDILDFSKIESGNMVLEESDFNIHDCVEEVLDIFAEKAAKSGIDLIYKINNNVPLYFKGDRLRLRQVLMNLVSNAVKFTEKGEVFVQVHLEDEITDEIKLLFTVKDSGIGIPADKLDKLFKAFSQVDSSTTRKYGGTGLGLIICEKLVQLMNGNISVSSVQGTGSEFNFTIIGKCAQIDKVSNSYTASKTLTGKRVLIVDDNKTNRTILHDQLLQWNMIPFEVADGYDALKLLISGNFYDLILSDMDMPGMDGEIFAIRAKALHPSTPILLLSSLSNNVSNNKVFTSIISKPIKHQLLYNEIEKALNRDTESLYLHSKNIELNENVMTLLGEKYPLNILVAEDDMFNQMIAVQLLETLGYTITVANNGKNAVDLFQTQFFDIVFMDIQMPVMDGYETTGYIRYNMNDQPVIIAMTANAMDGDKEKCINAGMNDYISKPIDFDELTDKIERWAQYIHLQKQTADVL